MAKLYFENGKTGKRYELVRRDGDKLVLKGEHGVEFSEPYDKDWFQRLGYKLVQG